ncbi:MAG: hypothetical protein ACOC5M_01245 [Chloroflexota bacterium]
MVIDAGRRIWMDDSEIPGEARALGVTVCGPMARIDDEHTLMSHKTVYVEVSAAEWEEIGGSQEKADRKATELGGWLAAQFGGVLVRWH